jgi:nickel-dependent lactate racemase
MDFDLFQSHKAIQHASLAVRDGGILILVSRCTKGIGPQGFYDLLSEAERPGDVRSLIGSRPYKLGDHTAARFAAVLDRIRVWAVTHLPSEVLRGVFVEAMSGLQQAVDRALSEMGSDTRLLVLTDATLAVPDLPE